MACVCIGCVNFGLNRSDRHGHTLLSHSDAQQRIYSFFAILRKGEYLVFPDVDQRIKNTFYIVDKLFLDHDLTLKRSQFVMQEF